MSEIKYAKVYFRVFPTENIDWTYIKIRDDHKTIHVRSTQQLSKSKENEKPAYWTFHSENVFYNHCQETIYENIAPDILESILGGRNAIFMAYGQTGSGKSLTLNGIYNSYADRGILPRLASDLLNYMNDGSKFNLRHCVQVSYVEFSKTGINDLLKPFPNQIQNIKDVLQIKVKSVEDTLRLIFQGEGRKTFSENSTYPSHSYSSIFTFYINTKYKGTQEDAIQIQKLHVIDFAGINTIGNYSCSFKNWHEIGSANMTKSQLEQFFLVLSYNVPKYVKIKQRLNPMIYYLGDCLDRTTIYRIVGHIRTTKEDLLITTSLLRFGELIGDLRFSKQEVKRDRVASREEELPSSPLTKYSAIHQDLSKSLNEERFAHIQRTINEYVKNKITFETLTNVCDVNLALEVMKLACQKCEKEKNARAETESSSRLNKPLSSANSFKKQGSLKGSLKTTSTTSADTVGRKVSQKPSRDKDRILSATNSVHNGSIAKMRDRASSASLLKRSSTSKRRSSSSVSGQDKPKSKEEIILLPQFLPEYRDAWNFYLLERNEEYNDLANKYKKNEEEAKLIYKLYLTEIARLKEIGERVEKYKNDLLMAKMTREYQRSDRYSNDFGKQVVGQVEECCMKELKKAEQEERQCQDNVLTYQAELRVCMDVCSETKKSLNQSFNAYCEEKYHTSVVNLQATQEHVTMYDDHEEEKIEKEIITTEEKNARLFEKLKLLMKHEKKKRRQYEEKHRNWWNFY